MVFSDYHAAQSQMQSRDVVASAQPRKPQVQYVVLEWEQNQKPTETIGGIALVICRTKSRNTGFHIPLIQFQSLLLSRHNRYPRIADRAIITALIQD